MVNRDMATAQTNEKYLLVSDSNEIGNKYDSKKLNVNELIDLAQDNLFKRDMDMSRYLTVQEYTIYQEQLEKIPTSQSFSSWKGKFRVVDGQVILLRAADVDREFSSPLEYLNKYWYITPEYRVVQIQECMLRGITRKNNDSRDQVMLPNNSKVAVSDANLPPHMHHSGIDMAPGLQTMQGGNSSEEVGFLGNEIRYDMFYNESFSTGVERNELDGVVDKFEVQNSGEETSGGKIYHNNMPVHDRFYAFVIQKITV